MASLDTISTLTELLDNDGFDYVIICVQETDNSSDKQPRVDIFHGVDKKNKSVLQDSLVAMSEIMDDADFECRKNKKKRKKK
jgi:hypothetical protein